MSGPRIFYEHDARLSDIARSQVAVVGYGNQGRPWALNLRDSGLAVTVCVRADETRERAEDDGFSTSALADAAGADIICVLVPDDAIPQLPLRPRREALVVVASGYTLAFDRFDPDCDVAMLAPRMLGPEVRRCYLDGVGFITALGVHRDLSGQARARTLAVAMAIGGLRQGAIEMTPRQEAVLDLAVEQALSPALRKVTESFVSVMLDNGIPLEAVVCELVLSGEVERTYRLLRREGYAAQLEHHSPVSQYGQLSRGPHFAHLEVAGPMREIVEEIASGRFAQEWDDERDSGFGEFRRLKEQAAGPAVRGFEQELRRRLGEFASPPTARSGDQ